MNILPKKRWHVRTKDNIARVRRDEAKAAEEARQLEKRIKLADQEARTSYLRKKAKERKPNLDDLGLNDLHSRATNEETTVSDALNKSSSIVAASGHVNFFQHLEDGESNSTSNKDREMEEKKEKEEYEKKIGLLTYLGQDTQELTGERSWWQKIPEKREIPGNEVESKQHKHLDMLDPLNSVRMHLGCKGVKKIADSVDSKLKKEHTSKKKTSKKHSSSSNSSDDEKSKRLKQKSTKRKEKKRKKSKRYLDDSVKEKNRKSRKGKKHKKHLDKESSSESKSDSDDYEKHRRKRNKYSNEDEEKIIKLEQLRKERLEREKISQARKNELLYGIRNDKKDSKINDNSSESGRKYNSQFNPQFAKQNKLDASQKYWLQ